MSVVYVTEQGAKLSAEKRRLIIRKDGDLIAKVPFAHTKSLILFGNIGLTTPAMKRLTQAGIDVVFLTRYGKYQARLIGELSKAGELRQKQYEMVRHEAHCLPIAQRIVAGKIHNMRTLLRRRQHADDARQQLTALIDRCWRTQRINSLLGVEGRASAIYFQALRGLFKYDWQFTNRKSRPPTDPVNVLLSFGYTVLTSALESAVWQVGLDPYLGVLHRPSYGRPSLALDLVEEFRSVIIDAVVLRVLNNEIITQQDFTTPPPEEASSYPLVLGDDGRKRFIKAIEDRLATEGKHPLTGETLDYRKIFHLQTRLMTRTFRDGSAYTPFAWR